MIGTPKSVSANNSILVQSEDRKVFSKKDFKIVSKKKPSKSQFENLIFPYSLHSYLMCNIEYRE